MTQHPVESSTPHTEAASSGGQPVPQPVPEEQLPSSVRGAPDLTQTAAAGTGVGAASSGSSSGSWRVEILTTEQFQEQAQHSTRGPVVIALYSGGDPEAVQAVDQLEGLIDQLQGQILLVSADAQKVPELAQAFQASSSLNVLALLAGRPAPMFNTPVPEAQMKDLLRQVVELARQNQLTGTFESVAREGEEKPLPPLHQEAQEALEREDYEAAAAAYQKALNDQPADHEAKLGLSRVSFLQRVRGGDQSGRSLDQLRQQAAQHPDDVEAQLRVADLDVFGGHVEDAFTRLLGLIRRTDGQERNQVRERLLELFEVVGPEDPRVGSARSQLMRALF